jgi:hypothetical protein
VRRFAILACLGLALLSPVAADTALVAPTGLVRTAVPGAGLTIGIPVSWRSIDARKLLDSATLTRFERENPSLKSSLDALARSGTTASFFAFDPVVHNGFATNLNVVVEHLQVHISVEAYARAAKSQLSKLPSISGPVEVLSGKLPAGPAVRLRYKLRVTASGKTYVVALRQFALVRGLDALVFTYATLPATVARYAPTFEASARSIRYS